MQAISYEFRKKPNNVFGSRTYETFLLLNGLIGTVFIGIAVGTFFNGSMFVLNDMNQVTWQGPARGLEAALNYKNVLLGLSVFFLARTLAILYFMNDIDSQDIFRRAKKHLYFNSIPFVILFLAFIITVFTAEGFAYSPQGEVYREPMKYLNNLIENPLLGILFLAGVGLVLSGIVMSLVRNTGKGIWYTGGGTILTVFCLFLVAGYNNTPFYPSVYDLQSSLTIENSSSSKFTLTVMSYVSLIVPFVIAYIFYAWRAINKHQISEEEMEKESHSY
jgi:cytochrome d ubiquinol oxidase subunit II